MEASHAWAVVITLTFVIMWSWKARKRNQAKEWWFSPQASLCLDEINAIRREAGVPALTQDTSLSKAASDYAMKMCVSKVLSNNLGGGVGKRAEGFGYPWSLICQVAGRTAKGGPHMARLWADASLPGRGVLSEAYTHIGVGAYRRHYCAILASPRKGVA